MSEERVPTLFEWAGGAQALRRLIDAFYDRVERDDLLSPFFPGGVHEAHRAHVTAWWVEVFGGPASYTQEHGGARRCAPTTVGSGSRRSSVSGSPR
jgi:hemoglobin